MTTSNEHNNAPAAGILDRARWDEQVANLTRLAEAADKAPAPAPEEAGSESKIVIDVGPGGSGGGPAEAALSAGDAVLAEREACAKLCEEVADDLITAMRKEGETDDEVMTILVTSARVCAKEIRGGYSKKFNPHNVAIAKATGATHD